MKRVVLIVCAAVVIGAIAYALYAQSTATAPTPVAKTPERSYSVSYEQSYDAGVHTISGSVMLDTPCDTVEASALEVGGDIRVDLRIPPLEGMCLQRPAAHEFSVDIEAPEEASVAIFVNGIAAIIE